MENNNVIPEQGSPTRSLSKKVTATILSMSLLTVMAGAAIAPALGIIKAHFSDASAMLVQFIVSMPALLIIVTNLFFLPLSRILRTRAIATTVMPLLSAALYLGQFVSPIIVTPASHVLFGSADLTGPYKVGIALCLLYVVQVYLTRHFQSLPPK